jgi:hypothetical protein
MPAFSALVGVRFWAVKGEASAKGGSASGGEDSPLLID